MQKNMQTQRATTVLHQFTREEVSQVSRFPRDESSLRRTY